MHTVQTNMIASGRVILSGILCRLHTFPHFRDGKISETQVLTAKLRSFPALLTLNCLTSEFCFRAHK
jgi:hypothetical protein